MCERNSRRRKNCMYYSFRYCYISSSWKGVNLRRSGIHKILCCGRGRGKYEDNRRNPVLHFPSPFQSSGILNLKAWISMVSEMFLTSSKVKHICSTTAVLFYLYTVTVLSRSYHLDWQRDIILNEVILRLRALKCLNHASDKYKK